MQDLCDPGAPIAFPPSNPIYLHATFAESSVNPLLQTVPQLPL